MSDDTALTDMAALLGDPAPSATVADRYRLHRLLGRGGMADVHEAIDTRLDRRVAVKLLREATANETDRARFLSEARLLARLSHPRLVRVLDAGVDRDRPFLVLELVRGSTLGDALVAPLPPARVSAIGADIAAALAHVHAAGVVHRDVKPGNVLVGEDGTARLADFGIARLVDDTSHHTRTGHVVGTVAYLAPEQVAGEPVTTAVDVYSLGLVLLESLTGGRAYAGTSVEVALARLHRAPAIPATLPAPWRELLTAMTARDPGDRPTAAQVVARLRGAATEARPAPGRRVVSARAVPARVVLAGAAAAFALLLGTAGWTSLSLPSGTASAAGKHHARAAEDRPAAARTPQPPATGAATTPDVVPATTSATNAADPAPVSRQGSPQHRHHARHQAHHRPGPPHRHAGHHPGGHHPGGHHRGNHGHHR
ncbi:MAG TPA: protein kinase [Nocardioides sp.]|uniref:serine/threonine-protein kinase n=1 Tax=Nocardioides sp. TaxID=35761 RepID=UPI002E34BF95|nr:protein kinase [Nocardioides sp.]HEX5089047.1 protein kinase [Nocardioides sp.]